MLIPDVNVLVGAYRTDAPDHGRLKSWLEASITGVEILGLTDAVLAGFVRIVTHPRIFRDPTPIDIALTQATSVSGAHGVIRVTPGPSFWTVFDRLCRESGARGNLVADASHAAIAIESGATWVTLDRGFARFPDLKWVSPLE